MGLIIGFAASLVILKFGYPLVVRVVAFVMDMIRIASRGRILSGRTSAWAAIIVHYSVYGALVGLAVATAWRHASGPQQAIVVALGSMSLLVDLLDHRQDLVMKAAGAIHEGQSEELLAQLVRLLEATPYGIVAAFVAAITAVFAPGLVLEGPVIRFLAIGFTAVLNFAQSIPLLKGLLGIVALIHIANAVFMTAVAAQSLGAPRASSAARSPQRSAQTTWAHQAQPPNPLNRNDALREAIHWALWRFSSPSDSAIEHATGVFKKSKAFGSKHRDVVHGFTFVANRYLDHRQPRDIDRKAVGRAAAEVLARGARDDDELEAAIRELAKWIRYDPTKTRSWVEKHVEPSDLTVG